MHIQVYTNTLHHITHPGQSLNKLSFQTHSTFRIILTNLVISNQQENNESYCKAYHEMAMQGTVLLEDHLQWIPLRSGIYHGLMTYRALSTLVSGVPPPTT